MKRLVFFTISILLIAVVVYLWPTKTLVWQEENGYRWRKLSLPWTGRNGFERLPPTKTNITFSNNLTKELVATNEHLLNGSGVALGDMDKDGLTDIYLCRLDGPNALYKNLGEWKFVDITESAGVACAGQYSTGAAFADIDGDGDLDLYFYGALQDSFYINNGKGKLVVRLALEQANSLREINASLSADREPLALAWANGSDSNCNVLHTWRSFWVSCCGGPEHPYSGFILAS